MRRSVMCAVAALMVAGCGATSRLDHVTYYDEVLQDPVIDYGQTVLSPDLGPIGRYVEGVFCAGPHEPIDAAALRPFIDNYRLGANWRSTMTRYGFQTTRPARRASNFYVEAAIVEADIEACRPPPGRQRTIRSYAGGASMTVNWTVRATADDTVAYTVQITSTAEESRDQQADLTALIEAVMADATHQLAADPGFRERFYTHSDDFVLENLSSL